MDPCGTPQDTSKFCEDSPFIVTRWYRFDKYEENHLFATPLIP